MALWAPGAAAPPHTGGGAGYARRGYVRKVERPGEDAAEPAEPRWSLRSGAAARAAAPEVSAGGKVVLRVEECSRGGRAWRTLKELHLTPAPGPGGGALEADAAARWRVLPTPDAISGKR